MCDEAVDERLAAVKRFSDWFVGGKMHDALQFYSLMMIYSFLMKILIRS